MLGVMACLTLASCTFTDRKVNIEAAESDEIKTKYAELLKITRGDGYIKVDIKRSKDKQADITYLLVPRGEALPKDMPTGTVIRVPVESLAVYSSVHASALKELGAIDVVKGVADAEYFKIHEIVAGLETGKVLDIGASSSPSLEKIIELAPDGVVISLYEGMNVMDLSSSGVAYIKFADNLETTPLGRAEWIKFIGLLTGREAKADSIFDEVKSRYVRLKNSVPKEVSRPKVMVETMYEGIWYVPGGDSFQAHLLADAGAIYPWSKDNSTGSLSLSYEAVLDKCEDADYWIVKVYGKTLTKSTLLEMDSRYSRFAPFVKGNVYYSDTSVSQLFEEFPFHPDLLLEDYIKIFHQEKGEAADMRYFSKIKE